MDFLADCARRLDAGAGAADVMHEFRARYSTIQCVNAKACQVRARCRPAQEYTAALDAFLEHERAQFCLGADASAAIRADLVERGRTTRGDADFCARMKEARLPPRLPDNVRAFTITQREMRDCKRTAAHRAMQKNWKCETVPGRALLAHGRTVARTAHASTPLPELVLALMLLTGRRECEVLNGTSVFARVGPHALSFQGQAKKRLPRGASEEEEDPVRVIPCLGTADDVLRLLGLLRARQGFRTEENAAVSRRYQSYLSRYLRAREPWKACKRVHSLRGVYACMCTKLFRWGECSDAFVTMYVLGHAGITDSLVYTPFRLGEAFVHEPVLDANEFSIDLILSSGSDRVGTVRPEA